MKRTLILVALTLFLCTTASAFQDGGGKPTKPPKPTPKPRPKWAPKPKVDPHKEARPSPLTKTPKTLKLNAHDMQIIFQEMLPPQEQQKIAADPEEKKKFVAGIKKLLAVAQVAEQEGYGQRPEVLAQTDLSYDLNLNKAYRKKHPDVKVTEEQVTAYYQSHPNDFETFLQNNPRFKQQAQGLQREAFKKQYGEFKVVADLARKEKLDDLDSTKLQVLIERSQILQNAYLSEIEKNADQSISDEEIGQYYNSHQGEFDEVRVRHVLISTQPKPEADEEGKKSAAPSKAMTKEEARQKAQSVLDRARKGEDFAKLAEQYSDDPGSNKKGGEYDFFPRGQMVSEYENAAFSLKPGEISDLVETPYGFHVIKVEARRPGPPPSDPKVRQRIIDKLKQKKIEARIAEISDKSPVVVSEDFDTTPKAGAQPQTSNTEPSGEAEQIERT